MAAGLTPKEAWKKLLDILPYNATKGQYEAFVSEISKYSGEVILKAFEHTRRHDTKFPSTKLFADYCDVFRQEQEDEEHRRRRRQETADIRNTPTFGNTKLGTEVREILKAFTMGQITRRQYSDKLMQLGINCDLLSYWEKQGMNPDEPIKKVAKIIWT